MKDPQTFKSDTQELPVARESKISFVAVVVLGKLS